MASLENNRLNTNSSAMANTLLKNGELLLKGIFSKIEMEELRIKAEDTLKVFKEQKGPIRNNSIFINNVFTYNQLFLEVISNEYICSIIEEAIGDTITIANSSLANITYVDGHEDVAYGGTWHTDSRYIQKGRVRLNHGFSYLVILCIEDFKNKKSSTKYVSGSHLFEGRPERDLNENDYEIKTINGKIGDVVILDSGMWHKAGIPTQESRWGLITYYTPWYFKPYYRFNEMFSDKDINNLSDRQLQLLHYTSIPPANQFESMNTLKSPELFRKNFIDK